MPANYFLKVPGITGSSTAPGHQGEVEVLSWSWGAVSSSSGYGGGAGGGAKPPTEIHVVKQTDDASPRLLAACASGLHFGQVIFTMEYGTATRVYELADVVIAAFSTSGNGGDDLRPTESVTLNFDHMGQKDS